MISHAVLLGNHSAVLMIFVLTIRSYLRIDSIIRIKLISLCFINTVHDI